MKYEAWNQFRNAFRIEAEALNIIGDFIENNKGPFSRGVAVLKNASHIGASGCGHTGIACQHFAQLMCCIERPARFISPSEGIHGAMGFLQKGDVMLLASRGGKAAELLPILDICKQKEVTVISLTENVSSVLALEADIFLPLKFFGEVDKYNSQGTTSFIVMCAIFDALQAAIIEEIDFQIERFAIIHHGSEMEERLRGKLS
jgi:D-arabinose 5-phosphate isomerase GutQ